MVAAGAGLALGACSQSPEARKELILWAWERPEDLRFLGAAEAGRTSVAVLVATVRIEARGWTLSPRHVPARISPDVRVIPVVRVEAGADAVLPVVEEVTSEILKVVGRDFDTLQLDFDAPASWRGFYREALAALRPRVKRLSVTALASWCMEDRWMGDLPVDEIVPMLFRMGPEGWRIRERLKASGRFVEPRCRESVGVATDEAAVIPPGARRVYVFHPRAWDEESFEQFSRPLR